MITKEQFREMCQNHDLTYSYSDDGRVWRRGEETKEKIIQAAKDLPLETVKEIWDSIVDSKIAEGYRKPFYWR